MFTLRLTLFSLKLMLYKKKNHIALGKYIKITQTHVHNKLYAFDFILTIYLYKIIKTTKADD